MSITTRRLVFYLLIALFLIVAPILIAFTTGYRYSFTQRRIVKIGALSVKTEPDGAQIRINGVIHTGTTPLLIANLLPGVYTVEISKNGYHSWKKTLIVQSAKTTFAHDIRLFLQTAPRLTALPPLPPPAAIPDSFKQYKIFHDRTRGQVVIIDNDKQARIAEIPGIRAVWQTRPDQNHPTFIVFSSHEAWSFSPKNNTRILITRLSEEIRDIIPLRDNEGMVLIVENRVRAIEADARGAQNSWELAVFDSITAAALAPDGKKLIIGGIFEKQKGVWELEL